MEKRRNWAISPLFHNIFNISLNSRVQLHIYLLNVALRIIFYSSLQIWYVEVRIYRSISESPLEFEKTRIDCIYLRLNPTNCFSYLAYKYRFQGQFGPGPCVRLIHQLTYFSKKVNSNNTTALSCYTKLATWSYFPFSVIGKSFPGK